MTLTETHLEQVTLNWLEGLGYTIKHALSPDDRTPERSAYSDVMLPHRLAAALRRFNPHLPDEALADVVRQLTQTQYPNLVAENRRLHTALTEGVDVEFYANDGTLQGDKAWAIDFINPDNNDWLAVNQLTVVEGQATRRPDVVVFINGLPIAVIELKHPTAENATIDGAFRQLQTYKAQVSNLFRFNGLLVISDGLHARVGSLTADYERFMPWRTVDGNTIEAKGKPELETLIKGVFNKRWILSLIKDFTVFGDTKEGVVKLVAAYHQFHAVRHAVDCTLAAIQPDGTRKIGVIWHTQGSGKSLLMAFYAGQIVAHPAMENPTLVILTDRNDLDDQLFGTFSLCKHLIRQTPQQADNREHLKALLNRQAGGVIFTTLQKITPDTGETTYPQLTDRRNVVVMADEAHRSQYGLGAKIDPKTGKMSYGFAKYLRDALPNASFIGFTGTPIETANTSTRDVFGDTIDTYDITRAVEDGATVPIYYESRLARIELDETGRQDLAEFSSELEEEDEKNQNYRLIEKLVGAAPRLASIASDLVQHFENRQVALKGKGLVVCMSRRICVDLYNEIIRLRPDWHSDDDKTGVVKVVMSGSASDPLEWQPHIGQQAKARRDTLSKRAKDPTDPLELVIVRDMWLTGFDAPSLHTLYVDKPMQGHSLMQAIARVNRVFSNKPSGLVVDYIGIAQRLKEALGVYSQSDQAEVGIDEQTAVALMLKQYEIVCDLLHGFNYKDGLNGSPEDRLRLMAGAMDWVLELQQAIAVDKTTPTDKKKAHRTYDDAVLALTKAYALASASDSAITIREEVGFFQAVRAALAKTRSTGSGLSTVDRELAIQQIISRAVVSTDIIDILKATGIQSQDISILSDEFLAEIMQYEKKNLALEALQKLLNGEIKAHSTKNVVQTRSFSQRLEEAITRYHNNAITSVQVLEELIKLAKEVKAARDRGEEQGLSYAEVAFYDALAENQSALTTIGDDKLKFIATLLYQQVKASITVDWMHRDAARARIRILVGKILRKYGYPPDLEQSAVQTVLAQAEALSLELAKN
jgi:type I restriction enzyme, R subunit